MSDISNSPPLTKRPRITYDRKQKQEVLLWLINHRIEDVDYSTNGGRWREDPTPGVEKEPRRMPDGSEKWFRAPTFMEAADFWKIPFGTIMHWWNRKIYIFEGVVPQSTIPLVHPSQRNKPKAQHRPTSELPGQTPHAAGISQHAGSDCWPLHPSAPHPHPQQLGPRLAAVPVYPQAIQPSGPPLHPLYRANFALGEISTEVSHMIQNQQNIHLENLLRAIGLSQALVNDLAEAQRVLLDPQSYPQYYPPPTYSPASQQQPCQVPPLHPLPPPLQSTGPHARTDNGRYIAIQPAPAQDRAHPLTPVYTPRTQSFQLQNHSPFLALPPQMGQQEGQHKWRLSCQGQHPIEPAEEAAAKREKASQLKRRYTSKDGPGGTMQLSDMPGDEMSISGDGGRTGREKRHCASGTRVVQGTTSVDQPNKTNGSGDAISSTRSLDGTNAQGGVEVSSDRQSTPIADATKQNALESVEHEPEAEPRKAPEDIGGGRRLYQTHNNGIWHQSTSSNIFSDAKNGLREGLSQHTVSTNRCNAESDKPLKSNTSSTVALPASKGNATADGPEIKADQEVIAMVDTTTEEPTKKDGLGGLHGVLPQ
ncbi:hypothetical protein N0V93_001754 [Gnomoniopsis smithogilvyi]|uniref:Uncharacterized protein n=1 Tax=Gnomoniopsis smithogilvyi TaxID=1191159 RepID=A0A9W8Z4J6_9PEZI|nr:hypothetical protein N0V93_001754 [Gnomoniopsis smithogilvyi]